MTYRFYEISARGFRSPPVEAECPTDIAAMMHAGGLLKSDGSLEVWQGKRFVGEIGQMFSRWADGREARGQQATMLEFLNPASPP